MEQSSTNKIGQAIRAVPLGEGEVAGAAGAAQSPVGAAAAPLSPGSVSRKKLLEWSASITAGYPNLPEHGVRNFDRDWVSGVAFCALIHRHRPDLLPWRRVKTSEGKESSWKANLQLAHSTALKHFGVPTVYDIDELLLDVDARQIATQVAEYYKALGNLEPKGVLPTHCLTCHRPLVQDAEVIVLADGGMLHAGCAKCRECGRQIEDWDSSVEDALGLTCRNCSLQDPQKSRLLQQDN